MGAINENNAIYLSIADGKISRRVRVPTETSVERTTKEGKVVNEEIYKGWQGRITDIRIKDHEQYGKYWMITLSDGKTDAILQMNYSSGYAGAFLKTLPHIDLTREISIIPNMQIIDDKKKTTVFINQDGKTLKHYWNKDNPRDLPQLAKIKIKGKLTYDDSDMMEYLETYVREQILPKLNKTVAAAVAEPEPMQSNENSFYSDDVEDVPF